MVRKSSYTDRDLTTFTKESFGAILGRTETNLSVTGEVGVDEDILVG